MLKAKVLLMWKLYQVKKIIPKVLYVLDIDQNLISVGKLLEKDYVLLFKNMTCIIFYPNGNELMTVRMNQKSFSFKMERLNCAYIHKPSK